MLTFRGWRWWVVLMSSVSTLAHADTKEECNLAAENAQPLRRDGKLNAARQELLVCARPSCPAVVRADCSTWLSEVDRGMPSVVVRAVDGTGADVVDVSVSVDGEVVATHLDGKGIALDPGAHHMRYRRSGSPSVEQSINVREGEQLRILSVSFPSPVSRPSLVLPITVMASGAALVGIAAYFYASGLGDRSSLQSCAPSCTSSQVDASRNQLIVGDVLTATGIITAAVGTWLLVSRYQSAPPVAVTASALPDGGSVSIIGRF